MDFSQTVLRAEMIKKRDISGKALLSDCGGFDVVHKVMHCVS